MSGVNKLLVLLSALLVLDSVQSNQAKRSLNDVKSNIFTFFMYLKSHEMIFFNKYCCRRIAERTDRPAAFSALQMSKYIYLSIEY